MLEHFYQRESGNTLIYLILSEINQQEGISRQTGVCHVAQEAGVPHHEYINRNKQNVIFTLL